MKTWKAVRTLFGANVAMLALAACVTINVYFPAAEAKAAALWDADWCRFSVAGSTHANQAIALAVAKPGDRVNAGSVLCRLHAVNVSQAQAAKRRLQAGFELGR